ncbi:MAG TPA: AAA family ATPase [Candidatus Limnocylindria bacterium]|nr:AAA family ATPase [Candidatus Limnocylindria bacterium]
MERPTILLAVIGDIDGYVAALQRAGFEPVTTDPAQVEMAPPTDLAVLDCDLPATAVQAMYAHLHKEERSTATLLLVGEQTELPKGIGGAGDEVALKPIPPEALVYRLQALMIRSGRHLPVESGAWAADETLSSAPVAGEGHVVSVFAPKGGVGKTTIAVNAAVALRMQTRSEVLLFDADVGVGNVTSVLEVPYRMGLADLADSPPEEWTDAAFEQIVTTHAASGVRVLTWGTDPGESERVSVDLLLAALRWARDHHSYVIVDNHPGYDDRTMAMLAVSNEIFLVVTPEVGALRNSSQFLELARELGLGNVIRVIVNRANHGIRVQDMASSLGLPISATVVSNGPKAVIASNEGLPLVTKYPREKIADDLHAVARLISQPDALNAPEAPHAARRWWTRLGTRTSQA